ncbi:MAG: winged helix-turn-helix transcriptional regulator [Candidatus Woesearchaeota archaeon]
MKLIKKDMRLLAELDRDGGQPLKKLASTVGVSPEVALYRISRLENEKVITGYYSITDVYKLGFNLFRMYIQSDFADDQSRTAFMKSMQSKDSTGQVSILGGDFDILLGFICKSNVSFQQEINSILSEYGGNIKSWQTSTVTSLHQFSRKYLLENKPVSEWVLGRSNDTIAVGETDMKVLAFLASHARSSSSMVERETGVPRKTVANRIRSLQENKILLGRRVSLARNFQDRTTYRIIIQLSQATTKEISALMEFLRNHRDVTYAMQCLGAWPVECELLADNAVSAYSFTESLRRMKGVSAVNTLLVLQDLKYEFTMPKGNE